MMEVPVMEMMIEVMVTMGADVRRCGKGDQGQFGRGNETL
jgi:hypothetical protein